MLSRNIKILIAIIVVVVLPTVAALAWYAVTKDPTIRPLGITKQALVEQTSDDGAMLTIVIRFDPDEDTKTSELLGTKIAYAFEAKGVVGSVKRLPVPGNEMTVTYLIGASTIGPYPASHASTGINAAVGAYRMIVPPEILEN
ncbi:hypothetical protein ALP8811_03093 [Aliiroseovarius pelagivivens]|uniref:Uncharacterized protein n=1 Tax=Aliiroseovarius pelagivivens TaxID=1639690 RepID=A0A2R8ASW9_9RHOB|nr:hypothetical protein [Aliiroseovarius pelagivivens]SPF79156.1 hypothetical protein ALP8811_03093 [Aliiroseovarius pelagivivens]